MAEGAKKMANMIVAVRGKVMGAVAVVAIGDGGIDGMRNVEGQYWDHSRVEVPKRRTDLCLREVVVVGGKKLLVRCETCPCGMGRGLRNCSRASNTE